MNISMSIKFRMNGSHAINKCLRRYSSVIPKTCVHISAPSQSKLHTFPRRTIHGTHPMRQLLPVISVLGVKSFAVAGPHSLVGGNQVQVSGFHSSCQCAAALSSGHSIIASESQRASESIIDVVPNDAANIQDIFTNVSEMGEQTLSSLGLGGYTPIGIIQHALEFAHVTLGLPWWGSIVCGTILFRILVFPLMIKGQVNAAKVNAIKPELERLQERIREAQNLQNPMKKEQGMQDLNDLFKKNDCHPLKAIISPLVQMPLFISFFIGLRRMATLPVETMKTGGVFWFPDLTAADPYYILPVLCAGSMWLTVEAGADVGMGTQMNKMKNVFRGMCVMMIPITYSFPTAIFTYWLTLNFLSLGQVLIMKQPKVKKYLGLPDVRIPPPDPNVKTTGFVENFKAGLNNAKRTAHVKQSEKIKKIKYKDSMKDVYQETFEYNPKLKKNEKLFQQANRSRNK